MPFRFTIFIAALPVFCVPAFAAQTISSQRLQDIDPATGEGFGRHVAISTGRPTMIVGMNGDDQIAADAGAALIYNRFLVGGWVRDQKLAPASLQAGDFFGWSVAIHGDVAVVGAPGDDRIMPDGNVVGIAPNRGAVYVFRRDVAGVWSLEARLEGSATNAGDEFGGRVAIHGDTIMVSAVYHDIPCGPLTVTCPPPEVSFDAGAVWVFRNIGGRWMEEATLTAARPQESTYAWDNGRFGFALALEGDQAVVGEPGANRAHYFARSGNTWTSRALQPRFPHQQVLSQSSPGVGPGVRFLDIRGIDRLPDGSFAILNGFRVTKVVRMTPDGAVTPLFTQPLQGGPEQTAAYDWLATDAAGNIYITPMTKVTKRTPDGEIVFLAGTDEAGLADGVGSQARFQTIKSIDADAEGNLYVIDGNRVRKIAPDGTVSTIVSSGLLNPVNLAVAPSGIVYVTDGLDPSTPTRLRAIDPVTHNVSMVLGESSTIRWIDVTPDGAVVFSDGFSQLRRWSSATGVQTIAASGSFVPFGAMSPAIDGPVGLARFRPERLVVESSGAVVFQNGIAAYVSQQSAVSRYENGSVTSLAGLPWDVRVTWGPVNGSYAAIAATPLLTPGALYGYSVDIRANRAVVSMPRATAPFTDVLDNGFAWVFEFATSEWSPNAPEWSPGTPIWSAQGRATERLGETVAILDNGDIALGGANGCTWVGAGVCDDESIGRSIENEVTPVRLFRTIGGHWTEVAQLTDPNITPRTGYGAALDAAGAFVAVGAPGSGIAPTNSAGSVIVFDLSTFKVDFDNDTLPDDWETQFGLSPSSALGDDGPTGDPDNDSVSNAAEYAAQTHPRNLASATRYFAEGATSSFFETRISVANPGTTDATVLLRFLRADGSVRSHVVAVPARQSRKVVVSSVPDMAIAEFSTVIESDQEVVVDRQMWWDKANAYGTHAETSIKEPALRWYFAEGATHSRFDLFYLLQNPSDTAAQVRVRYLQPSGALLEKSYTVAPRSRFNIWANQEEFPAGSGNKLLAATEVSAVFEVQNNAPIIAERAMYQSGSTLFEAGHESAGVTTPSSTWFFAEGATGSYFDMFLLIANPSDTDDVDVRVRYLLQDGRTLAKTYRLARNSRFNIWVDREQFPDDNGGTVAALEDTAVSAVVESLNPYAPVIAERAMWWPGPTAATWVEAHNAFGATSSGTLWEFAEGKIEGPPTNTATYFLVANTDTESARIRVTLLFDDGGAPVTKEFDVLAQSRFSIDVRDKFPEAIGRGFGAVVESIGESPAPIVVERAMYNDALGTFWRAGSDALGTKLR